MTVICLKGRQQVYGARLERAPHLQYIGRACSMGGWRLPRSIWANPFTIKECGSAEAAVAAYETWMLEPGQSWLRARIGELEGKDLACWCRDAQPCHGIFLVTFARRGGVFADGGSR